MFVQKNMARKGLIFLVTVVVIVRLSIALNAGDSRQSEIIRAVAEFKKLVENFLQRECYCSCCQTVPSAHSHGLRSPGCTAAFYNGWASSRRRQPCTRIHSKGSRPSSALGSSG